MDEANGTNSRLEAGGRTPVPTEVLHASEVAARQGGGRLVLVASRRSDLPAFHLDELVEGLRRGRFYPQPPRQPLRELRFGPADIHSLGLWSQNFSAWLPRRREVERLGYRCWYRCTIMPDDPWCKPFAPPVDLQLRTLEDLVQGATAGAVTVAVDPLIVYRRLGETDWRDNAPAAALERIFAAIAALGLPEVTTSLYDPYPRAEVRAKARGLVFANPGSPEGRPVYERVIQRFQGLAASMGLRVRTCAEPLLADREGCSAGACVDGARLNALFGPGASESPDKGQRRNKGCGCTRALDVGRSVEHGPLGHVCGHRCPQCYARAHR